MNFGKIPGFAFEKYSVKGYNVEHRTFAHRYYTRVIASMFIFTASSNADPSGVSIAFESDRGEPSADIQFNDEQPYNSNYTTATAQCGLTMIPEDERYSQRRTVCVVASAVRILIFWFIEEF